MNVIRPISGFTAEQLINKLAQARSQLRALIDCLPEDGWFGPRAGHLNPPLWEYGHIVWFQERWCLRERPDGRCAASLLPGADDLYDSSNVPHDSRWDLPLLEPAAVDDYASRVIEGMMLRLRSDFSDELAYLAELCIYHELMHIEAWWMAFQNLGYAPPLRPEHSRNVANPPERLEFSGSGLVLGSGADEGFIFDNEKWRHPVMLPAFDIDAIPVTETVFATFVDAGGYERSAGWSEMGWAWRVSSGASHPAYWRKVQGAWQKRGFEQWIPLDPVMPMLHVNRHEAEACAAWLGRRLPTAGEWRRATDHEAFRWGASWEWLRDPFAPYPGFSADPYRDYSQPWFHTHGELRGGGPVTDPHLKRPGFRNFYLPHRRDPFAGFRTAGPV